jgi:thioredoxin reductase
MTSERTEPPDEASPGEQKTLFSAALADPRARAAVVREGAGSHAARRASATSDETRPRHLAIAGMCGVVGVTVAAMSAPGSVVGRSGPGPLTPSHVTAGLTCEKCHGTTTVGTPEHHEAAKKACVSCHGPHPSTREGHRKATKSGAMGCPTCHTIHGPQQGARFTDDGTAIRYGTDGEASVPDLAFHAGRTVVVPIVPEKVCLGCHSTSANDPFSRCRVASLAKEGDHAPSVCFDEHQETLPLDASDVTKKPAPRRPNDRRADARADETPSLPKKGVCAEQHFADRPHAWEAAREAAIRVPWVGPGAGKASALSWAGVGGAAALLGYAASRAVEALRSRKRTDKKPSTVKAAERKRLPVIDTATCLGCYACVDACPYGVLEVERYVAVVARPDACCGLLLCEQKCPNGSLKVAEGEVIGDRPRVGESLESLDVPGLFLAGDVTGLPLIKNAILQGAHAAERAVASLDRAEAAPPNVVDLCIVGAGPSGISAALRAKELGARYVVLEQSDVAASIKSFPRGKLVFDQPLDLPLTGKLWLEESTKEELLMHWMRIVRKERLDIREGLRVDTISRSAEGTFTVRASGADGATTQVAARTVLVAIGKRGTPRKLAAPVPEALEAVVHYHLADARSFADRSVIVVGLGDSAMEAAIALTAAGSSVTIVHRGATYSRGQTRNIDETERLRRAGRLTVLLGSEIRSLAPGGRDDGTRPAPGLARIAGPEGRVREVPFDAIFVLVGNIAPWDTLARFGVRPVGDIDGKRRDGAAEVERVRQ